MRAAVEELAARGPFPAQDEIDDDDLERRETLLGEIEPPVTDEEARTLSGLFGPDDCYGLGWTMLHLVESAPGWPLEDALQNEDNEWIRLLRQRLQNAQESQQT